MQLQNLDGKGLAIVASKDLEAGEILFVEQPFAYMPSVPLLQQGSMQLLATRKQDAQEYMRIMAAGKGEISPEMASCSNAIAFHGTSKCFRQNLWGTNLMNASKDDQAPGYAWSKRQLQIFKKAMELEDSFRHFPQRLLPESSLVSPMPSCSIGVDRLDADHVRLLGSCMEEAFVVGLTSDEGKRLNGDHGPIVDHIIKKKQADDNSFVNEYRCKVLFEETGLTKQIKRSHLKTLPGVVLTNAFEIANDAGQDTHVLCSLASRFNHSCSPNVSYCPLLLVKKGPTQAGEGEPACRSHMVFVTLKNVKAGDELTMNYLGWSADKQGCTFMDVTARRHRLARRYNFHCECPLCMAQAKTA